MWTETTFTLPEPCRFICFMVYANELGSTELYVSVSFLCTVPELYSVQCTYSGSTVNMIPVLF